MTINLADNDPRIEYTVTAGNSQQVFTVPFEFFEDGDLNVYQDGTLKTLTTHYRTADNNDASNPTSHTSGTTGFVHFTAGNIPNAVGSDISIVITRAIDKKRTTDFPSSGPFDVASLNEELDKLVAISAELQDGIDRSLRLTDFDIDATLTLPDVDSRKGRLLAFNATTGAVEAGATISGTTTVSGVAADIETLADIEDGTVATNAIQDVAAIASNVTSVANIDSNVSTVAGISANVTTVAGISADTTTVAGISSNVTTVSGISANVTTVAGDSADIQTVAGDSSDIQTLAALSTEIGSLGTSANVSNMSALAVTAVINDMDALGDLTTELGDLGAITSDITAVSGISANVTTVAGDSANIGTVATNIAGINSFAERYRVGASDPTTSLDEGDLAYNSTANQLKYYNGTSWQGIAPGISSVSADANPSLGGDLDANGNNINFGDNDKAQFGAGNDLQIYHDGSHTYIKEDGTGNLHIQGHNVVVEDVSGNNMAFFHDGQEVSLYYNGSKKIETTNTGVDVTGNVTFDDSGKAIFGAGDDLQIYHTGAYSAIVDAGTGNLVVAADDLQMTNAAVSENYIRAYNNDRVELYYDNGERFRTTSTGVTVSGTAIATTDTDTTNTGTVTLDFGANQNFVLTLTGNVTLANPTTEQVGQSGFITFIQDTTGGRTVSLGTDYETAGGAGLTLSSAASTTDLVPYVVVASGRILLGAPQLAFS